MGRRTALTAHTVLHADGASGEGAAAVGAPPIDLVDGERLMEKLKELRLGVIIDMIEKVEVDHAWFASI